MFDMKRGVTHLSTGKCQYFLYLDMNHHLLYLYRLVDVYIICTSNRDATITAANVCCIWALDNIYLCKTVAIT